MSEPIVRYPLDPTGTNPNNLVVGELHPLSTRPNRAAATTYGAYFSESIQVYDNGNNRLLVKGVDYKCCELMQEPTLLFGKEICLLILIINSEVSGVIRTNYQALGGHYQNSAGEIINLYETVMHDNRAVDWLNIINKPYEYPPNLHRHLLGDIYGFEPVVFALERIRNALLLSDIPAFEVLIDWLKAQLVDLKAHLLDYSNPHRTTKDQVGLEYVENYPIVTYDDIKNKVPVDKYVTHRMFLYMINNFIKNYDFYLIANYKAIYEGSLITMTVNTKNIPDGSIYYWRIVHLSSTKDDFYANSGIITICNNKAVFTITALYNYFDEGNNDFFVIISPESIDGPPIASSKILTIKEFVINNDDALFGYLLADSVFNPNIDLNADSCFMLDSKYESINNRKMYSNDVYIPDIFGPNITYLTATTFHYITNYENNRAYTLTAISGTVSRVANKITYTAPSNVPEGDVGFIINGVRITLEYLLP